MALFLEQPSSPAIRIRVIDGLAKSAHRGKSRPCLAASGRRRVQVRGPHRKNAHLPTMSRRVTVLPQGIVPGQDAIVSVLEEWFGPGKVKWSLKGIAAIFGIGGKEAAKNVADALRPRGVPDGWAAEAGRKANNTKYVNPANPHDYVRVKPDGTITQVRNGKAFDVNGNPVDLRSPDAHGITPDQFIFRE